MSEEKTGSDGIEEGCNKSLHDSFYRILGGYKKI